MWVGSPPLWPTQQQKEKMIKKNKRWRSLTICSKNSLYAPHMDTTAFFSTLNSNCIIRSARESLTYPIFIVITLCFDYRGSHDIKVRRSFLSISHAKRDLKGIEKILSSAPLSLWPWTWMPNIFINFLFCVKIENLNYHLRDGLNWICNHFLADLSHTTSFLGG